MRLASGRCLLIFCSFSVKRGAIAFTRMYHVSLGCYSARLARFNVAESKTIFFQGLSSPLAALFVGWVGIGLAPLPLVCYPFLAGLLAFLMNVPLPLLKTKGFQYVPKHFLMFTGFVLVLGMVCKLLFETSLLIPLGLLLYLLLSLTTFHRLKDKS